MAIPDRWLRAATAIILLFSVTLKIHEGCGSVALAMDRRLFVALICGETLLLAWTCAGWHPQALRRTMIATFTCFCVAASWKLAQGASSCGCFGTLRVPPAITAALDAVLALAWWRTPVTPSNRFPWLGAGILLAALPAVLFVALRDQALPRPSAMASTSLMPTPLLEGTWMILAYRNDCPHCQAEFATWADALRRGRHRQGVRWACVEIGPQWVEQGLYAEAGLSADIALHLHWPGLAVSETPTALRVVDGRILATFRDPWDVE